MAKVRALKDAYTQEPFWLDPYRRQLRRIVGALTWPSINTSAGERPGCVIVLGESRTPPLEVGQERRDVWRLAEAQSNDVAELLEKLARFQEDWMVKSWATPIQDNRVYLLDDVNDTLRALRKPRIRYGDPVGWSGKGEGLMPFYHALVQRRTLSEKTLFLGHPSAAADEVAALDPKDAIAKPTDFPSAAALFFALAEIDLHRLADWDKRGSGKLLKPADSIGGY